MAMLEEMLPKVAERHNLRGYLIGNLGRGVPGRPHPTDGQISLGDATPTVTLSPPIELAVMVTNLWFPVLSRFSIVGGSLIRNSYRSLLCHIYELVKLGSNWA